MKKSGLIVSLCFMSLLCYSVNLYSGELVSAHSASLIPSNARYEIVQSHLAAKGTFRIDKYNGNVYQLVKDDNDDLGWQLIPRLKHPQDIQKENTVNYQIFASGLAYKFTFLMNIWTGATWQLAEDTKTKGLFWSPLILRENIESTHIENTESSTTDTAINNENDNSYSAVNDPDSVFYKK